MILSNYLSFRLMLVVGHFVVEMCIRERPFYKRHLKFQLDQNCMKTVVLMHSLLWFIISRATNPQDGEVKTLN